MASPQPSPDRSESSPPRTSSACSTAPAAHCRGRLLARPTWHVAEPETGHRPMSSRPREPACVLREAAAL
ncbi:hypothetical protein PUR61_11350 [Streptomyces sp. BE20]|uniref:hypothetical protein n=1 Tax=Streptomyces sp. BE20 TaxID=3002525 RepID=UPI002E762E8C|nr:hypothetical protein [Streptomyces sp. BE20]MEE1822785.1 hypothetical protein [Streptomyces sp. BE20]